VRTRIRPTWFGATLATFLVAGRLAAPAAADPQVAGLAGAALGAVLVIGIVWPVVAIATTRVRVVEAPSDATAGGPLPARIAIRGAAGTVTCRLVTPGGSPPWQRVDAGVESRLDALAGRRGMVEDVVVEVRTAAPLGVVSVRRRVRCPLPGPLWVAPSPTSEWWVPGALTGIATDATAAAGALVGDVVRSVRPYRSGDPAHLVHWPTTARVGELAVRELEPPAERGAVVVVHLPADPARADELASVAAGWLWAIHGAGGHVVLCTHDEASGARTTRVATPVEAGRQLAVASPGSPGAPPAGWPVVVVGP
jgi:uncharacterized protein (DUF58 family)